MHTKVIRCQPYHYAFSVLSFILCIPQQTQASVIKLLVSLSLLILNMITFIYILNICEYDVSNMYIIYTCMLCILLSLSLYLSVSRYLSLEHLLQRKRLQTIKHRRKKICKNSLPYIISNEFTCLQIPSRSHVKWTTKEHVALHKLFGAYRGTAVSITSCIQPVLQCFPVSVKVLKARSIPEIRDKIRGLVKKY